MHPVIKRMARERQDNRGEIGLMTEFKGNPSELCLEEGSEKRTEKLVSVSQVCEYLSGEVWPLCHK